MQKYICIMILITSLISCSAVPTQNTMEPTETVFGFSNPASVFCKENGNRIEIRIAEDGSQFGVCILKDGNECDEWAYFRRECGPDSQKILTSTITFVPTEYQSDSGKQGIASDKILTPIPTGTEIVITEEPFSGVRVTYIGNAGFMITTSYKKILIDALFRGIDHLYKLPEDIQNTLALAQPPFDNIDLILVSHSHRDHLSSSLVQQHLQNDPGATFASQSRIAKQFSNLENQIIFLDPAPGKPVLVDANGIQVEALSLSHGVGQPENIGFVITVDNTKIFFSGDVDFSQVSFEEFRAYNLPEKKIDLVFLTHFYFTADPSEQRLIKEGISGKYLFPIHYFYSDPPFNQGNVRRNYPDAIFFNGELTSWEMPE